MSRPAALSLRVYCLLARAFPDEFRNAYGEEIVKVTEASVEDIWRHHGLTGLVRLLLDLAVRIPAEHLAEVWQDIRYGIRMLAASPGFTLVALTSLSLGISVATSSFSKLNATVFRNLPQVSRPEALVAIEKPVSYPNYLQYREHHELFSASFAYVAPVPFGVALGVQTKRVWGQLVTSDYFPALGVGTVRGRSFDQSRQQRGGPPEVVVSYRFWQTNLASDPSVIGSTLRINGHACTVLGVAPQDFLGVSPMIYPADLWMPVSVDAAVAPELAGDALERRGMKMFHVVGRMQPGISAARVEAELDAVTRQLEQTYSDPERNRPGQRVQLVPGGKMTPIRSQDLPKLTVFPLVLVSLILLLACSNVANMMLARAGLRRREIAVRLALGASRARLVRQLLTESMLLATAAGALGLTLTVWILSWSTQIKLPLPIPINYDMTPDGRVLVFTLILTVLTGLAFGLVPALQATRQDLTPALKEGGAANLRRYRGLSLRNGLVLAQVSASLMLLLLTGFMVMGFHRTSGIDPGFDPKNLYLISLDPMRDGYSGEQSAAFFQKLSDRVKTLPAVSASALTESVPMAPMGGGSVAFSSTGNDPSSPRVIHSARQHVIGRDYFETLGIPLLLGRPFRKEDEASGATAIIVSEKLWRECWQHEDPLGHRIEIGSDDAPGSGLDALAIFDPRPRAAAKARQVFEVVGVVKDMKAAFEMGDSPPAIYFPLRPTDYAQPSLAGITLMVRGVPGVDAIAAVRREISAIDAHLTPFHAQSMPEQIEELMFLVRMGLWIYGFIGVFGLILASVGLAGVTAYSVARRGREIGIRVALGATQGNVLGLVMREGVALVAVGTVIGMAGAWTATKVLSAMISVVASATSASTSDPLLLVGAPALLAALALVACYLPARKSMSIDPASALRQE
jgi:macrolide transport system ATP-binding/permease protein